MKKLILPFVAIVALMGMSFTKTKSSKLNPVKNESLIISKMEKNDAVGAKNHLDVTDNVIVGMNAEALQFIFGVKGNGTNNSSQKLNNVLTKY